MQTRTTESKQLLRLKDVMKRTGMSKTHVYRLIGLGKFPPQTKLSTRFVVWDSDQIANWIDLQLAAPMRLAG